MALSKEQLAAVQQHVARKAACPTNVVDRLDGFAVGLAMAVEIIGGIENLRLEEPAERAPEPKELRKRVRSKPAAAPPELATEQEAAPPAPPPVADVPLSMADVAAEE